MSSEAPPRLRIASIGTMRPKGAPAGEIVDLPGGRYHMFVCDDADFMALAARMPHEIDWCDIDGHRVGFLPVADEVTPPSPSMKVLW